MTDPAGGRVEYTTAPWLVAAMVAGCLGAAYAATAVGGPGAVLFLVIAAGAAVEAARALLHRPTLVANADGFDVAVGVRRERHRWSEVTAVGTLEPRGGRPRRRANALEIDLGERLLIVPAYRLGAPAGEVAEVLARLPGRGTSDVS